MITLKDIVLTLTAQEAQEVLRIDLDKDSVGALAFIQSVLAKKVRESLKIR